MQYTALHNDEHCNQTWNTPHIHVHVVTLYSSTIICEWIWETADLEQKIVFWRSTALKTEIHHVDVCTAVLENSCTTSFTAHASSTYVQSYLSTDTATLDALLLTTAERLRLVHSINACIYQVHDRQKCSVLSQIFSTRCKLSYIGGYAKNTRMESESILASHCVAPSTNTWAM